MTCSRLAHSWGELHSEGHFRPSSEFARPRLDWDGLFGEDSPYFNADYSKLLSVEQNHVFAEAAERIRATMSILDGRGDAFGLIHGDLLAKNIVFARGKPAALDFEYCGWGYFLYDLAPLLWQLKGERADDFRELEDALWTGYSAQRAVSSADRQKLEDFIAARQLASCRWLLANGHLPQVRENAPRLIAARAEALEGYLESGTLRRQSPTL